MAFVRSPPTKKSGVGVSSVLVSARASTWVVCGQPRNVSLRTSGDFTAAAGSVEEQLELGNIRTTDAELVYTSSFLSVVARWEAFLEDLLLEAVCGTVPVKVKRLRFARFASRAHLRSDAFFCTRTKTTFR